jgi:hypothetical protein
MGEGVTLDRIAYQKLINEDIKALNKFMPEHSLEKRHIIAVLMWSINKEYPIAIWGNNTYNPDVQLDMTTSVDINEDFHPSTEEDLFWMIRNNEIDDLNNDL